MKTQLPLSDGSLPSVKALGILWKAEEDILTFQPACETNDSCTKRVLLKIVASLASGFLSTIYYSWEGAITRGLASR